LDHELGREVLLKAAQMYQELAGARVASMVYDEIAQPNERPTITFPASEIERYLGLSLPTEQVESILKQLGCSVEATANGWQVTPPNFRTDLEIPADLVEEVVRIYGYHKVPSRILATEIPVAYPTNDNFAAEELVGQTLADLGYQEQITYSLVSHVGEDDDALALKNSLTTDKEVLRTSLIPSHLEVMRTQWGSTSLRGTYELANVYASREGELPDEHLVLAIVDRDLRALYSTLEVLWNRLFIVSKDIKVSHDIRKKGEYIEGIFESSAIITLNDRVLGTIGWLENGLAGVELQWRELLVVAKRWPEYQPLPKTSALLEDWTVEISAESAVGSVREALLAVDSRIQSVTLINQYQQRWTFRVTMQDRQQQLSSEDAMQIRGRAAFQLQAINAVLLTD
jgi:phenylalanyl-tRNA synthetase beta subunit